jgi:hypothetical protein
MSITYTLDSSAVIGGKRWIFGTYTDSSAGTAGDVVTGLKTVDSFTVQPKGTGTATNQTVIVEALPVDSASGAVTIRSDASQVGYYIAIGH